MGNDVAARMIIAMENILEEKIMEKKYDDGIERATTFIDSVLGRENASADRSFSPSLLLFFSMRARLYAGKDASMGKPENQDRMRADMQSAKEALDAHSPKLSAEDRDKLKTSIDNLCGADESLANASLEHIAGAAKHPSRSFVLNQLKPSVGEDAHPALRKMAYIALCAAIGAVIWGLAALMMYFGFRAHNIIIKMAMIFIPFFACFSIAMYGWDWYSQYKSGTRGNSIKTLAMVGIMVTLVGFLFVFYWTGRAPFKRAVGNP